jgi:hypothetical protein
MPVIQSFAVNVNEIIPFICVNHCETFGIIHHARMVYTEMKVVFG